MMVTFVSQCQKKALNRTRRVLDAFANRIGDNTWQTIITQEGLQAVKKLLRKTATKNTAVSCHWIRSRSRSELVWAVGNRSKFDLQGNVPVNRTNNMQLKTELDDNWNTSSVIALLSAIAGLFHDVGKANVLFQNKLFDIGKLKFEPYRHEWVSLRIFEAFVLSSGENDHAWLERLLEIQPKDEKSILKQLKKDNLSEEVKDKKNRQDNPFKSLPELAKTVAWLIISHHRLPKFQKAKSIGYEPSFDYVERWLTDSFHWHWNALNAESDKFTKTVFNKNWLFKHGTPLSSKTWCDKAHQLAKRAINNPLLLTQNWLNDPFTAHLSRLSLMLSDHVYSAGDANIHWQDPQYQAYANTDKQGEAKQKLDEHNIGVAHNAYILTKELSTFKRNLPSMGRIKKLESNTSINRFKWQNHAYKLATSIKTTVKKKGFFGVNMASTGCGKTLANLKIMYGLADPIIGSRVSIALGLRTLTQQTGTALSQLLGLAEDDIATMIGSQAIKHLQAVYQNDIAKTGSESADQLINQNHTVQYDGQLYDGNLSKWLNKDPRLHRMVSAPILVSTIDHLIPATEAERGGKQIAPMLRLLSSDLILDEPDDFNLEDLPALCRLVNWAGMLGSNVLISSATLPPSIISALFDAYLSGRQCFDKACGETRTTQIHCAWFDEMIKPQLHTLNSLSDFQQKQLAFVSQRCVELAKLKPKRIAEILPVLASSTNQQDVIEAVSLTILKGINELHSRYHLKHQSGKKVSVGLVRMANINPLVAVAKQFTQLSPQSDQQVHFCIYHSRHPLVVRSYIERNLDNILKRDDEAQFWQQPQIDERINNSSKQHHIFIVFATAVSEVGRDHDYDWAIVEPSSMRSVIQLAGRVWRHRDKTCDKPNIMLLDQNFRALKGDEIAFTQPGFESKNFPLQTHSLTDLIAQHDLSPISAQSRINPVSNLPLDNSLIALEHAHMQEVLFGEAKKIKAYAANWWQHPLHWNAELQRLTPFRQSQSDARLIFFMEDEFDEVLPYIDAEDGTEPKQAEIKVIEKNDYAVGVTPWFDLALKPLVEELVIREGMSWSYISKVYTELRVEQKWSDYNYEADFGLYRALDD